MLVQQRVGAYCTNIHAQTRHLLRVAAQDVSISGLAQQAPSSGAQQQYQLPTGGMGGAPTGRQPIDQAVVVVGEGRQEFVPGILRSSQASRQVSSCGDTTSAAQTGGGRKGGSAGRDDAAMGMILHDLSVSTGSLSFCLFNWLFSLFPISLSLS